MTQISSLHDSHNFQVRIREHRNHSSRKPQRAAPAGHRQFHAGCAAAKNLGIKSALIPLRKSGPGSFRRGVLRSKPESRYSLGVKRLFFKVKQSHNPPGGHRTLGLVGTRLTN